MADRNASPSFSQPRKPPDDVIQGVASQMVLNAALRRQDYNATHPTARPDAANSPRPEAMNVPDAGQMKSRTSRSEAQKSTGLASRTEVKPPRPPLQKLDSARVDTRDGRPPGRPPSATQMTSQVRAPSANVRERLGNSMERRSDEIKAKHDERQASAREKRHLLNEAKRCQSPAKPNPAKPQQMVLRPVGFSSKGESYQVVSSTRERPPSPAQRQRMELLKAQKKHKSSAVKTVEKLEAAQKRREVILEEKKGTNRKKGIRLPDQYTSTVLQPLKLANDGESYTVDVTTRARSPSPVPTVIKRLAETKAKAKEPEVIAAEQARRQDASAERRKVIRDAKKKQNRLKSEDVAKLCRERAAQLEAAAAKEAKPTQSCGKLMDPETEEALYRDYSRKMKEKLGLSDYEYTGKDTAPLQGPTTDLTGRPEGTVPTTAPRMLATAAPPTRKVHSLMSHVTASWWMESPRTRQMATRAKTGLPPLTPRVNLTASATAGVTEVKDDSVKMSRDDTGKISKDLLAQEVEDHRSSPATVQTFDDTDDDDLSVETLSLCEEQVVPCTPNPSLNSVTPPPTPPALQMSPLSSATCHSLVTSPVTAMDLAPYPVTSPVTVMGLPSSSRVSTKSTLSLTSPSPVPSPVAAMCLFSQTGKLLPKCLRDVKSLWKGRGLSTQKFMQNLKLCRKTRVNPVDGFPQEMRAENENISDNTPADRAPSDDAKLKTRIHAWFASKFPTKKSQADKSAPKPPKPYKISKIKAIRIVDGEVIELGGHKKGLRKLLCWK